jgi:hypothetical protein
MKQVDCFNDLSVEQITSDIYLEYFLISFCVLLGTVCI